MVLESVTRSFYVDVVVEVVVVVPVLAVANEPNVWT